eukprot:scaffold1038_cov100-Cylindrotheca_fusiformis.AAC.8
MNGLGLSIKAMRSRQAFALAMIHLLFVLGLRTSLNLSLAHSENSLSSSYLQYELDRMKQGLGNKNRDIYMSEKFARKGWDKSSRRLLPNSTLPSGTCECVYCEKDPFCGRLWSGNQVLGKRDNLNIGDIPVHVVVSYCKGDLGFIEAMTEGFNVASIHIVSKCGYPVEGTPSGAVIDILPNVGRCDHTYAHYIAHILDEELEKANDTQSGDAVVMFLKDNAGARNLHQSGRWNSFTNMLEVAASEAGFSCGIVPETLGRGSLKKQELQLSAHFHAESLRAFQISSYGSRADYKSDSIPFESDYHTLGSFYDHLGAEPVDREIVQVCFGGVFAASVSRIKQQKTKVWKRLEESLSRGDNIQEGHYAERMWGMLLAPPLEPYQVEAIKAYSDTIFLPGEYEVNSGKASVVGILARKIPYSTSSD